MHRPQTKRCQQALEMVADTVDSVNDLKSVIEKQSLNQDNMNTDSEGKAVRELDVVSFIRVPHHQQMRDWDCGVSCVLMICRYVYSCV